jgi:O-antigen/teichoic acid export membrane protein
MTLPPPAQPSSVAARRWHALGSTFGASVLAKVLSVLCTLAQVPVALHYLGPGGYGLWVTLMSLIVALNFIDFGLGVGIQRAMAQRFGENDVAALRASFWTGCALLGILGLAALAVGLPVILAGNWAAALAVDAGTLPAADVNRALVIVLAAFACGLPCNAVSRLAAAVQLGWLHAGWIAGGSLLTLGTVVYAARAQWGFLGFLAAAAFVPVLQGAGLAVHLHHRLGWHWRPVWLRSREERSALLGASFTFALPQVGLALAQSLPPLAISLASGPAAVTAYNLLQRLYSPLAQGQLFLLTPLWPMYTEASVRGDRLWVRRGFRLSLIATAGLVGLLVVTTLFSGPLLDWWVGPAAGAIPRRLAWLTCLWTAGQLAVQPLIYFLVGVDRLGPLAKAAVPGQVVTLVGLFAGGQLAGAEGAMAGAAAGLMVVTLPALAVATGRALPARPVPAAP